MDGWLTDGYIAVLHACIIGMCHDSQSAVNSKTCPWIQKLKVRPH